MRAIPQAGVTNADVETIETVRRRAASQRHTETMRRDTSRTLRYACWGTMKGGCMTRQTTIERSLELWAERSGDPAAAVYARLFALKPEFERLFALDRTGAVRGNMLTVALDAILDIAGPNAWGMNFLLAERVNHSGVNVPDTEFLLFVSAIRDTARDALSAEWTDVFDGAWDSVIGEIEAACAVE